ncbi:MAG: hypothetical protein EA416_02475 [Trueperaceae bacterium]|nr:MAG: hypothetical protein EA416_02475 [Trueperaceae bacterium]
MKRPATPRRRLALLLAVIAAAALIGVASAQAGGASRSAGLELGFGGAVVADAWNPFRLVLRDVGPVTFELAIDRGTLRDGERWSVYRADLPGGSGLSVVEDEVFVPVWRSLSWTVRSGGLTIASGSVARTQADRRPLDIIVGEPGPVVRGSVMGGRSVDLAADRLPLRSAAYDGVGRVIVATPSARPQALLAAAVGGAEVVLTPSALANAELSAIIPAGGGERLVGAGRIVSLDVWRPTADTVARVDQAALLSAFAAAERISLPRPAPVLPLLVAASGYALVVLLVLRFAGVPGVTAALVLALGASLAVWTPLRPERPTIDTSRDLVIGAEGIGQRWRLHERVTLPAQTLVLDVAGWPLSDVEARLGPASVAVDLPRWRHLTVVERPRTAALPLLQQADGSWRNQGTVPLTVVVIRGGDHVDDVPADALVPPPSRDPRPLPSVALALLELVPEGAAVASDGARWFVALPSTVLAEAVP